MSWCNGLFENRNSKGKETPTTRGGFVLLETFTWIDTVHWFFYAQVFLCAVSPATKVYH